MKQEYDDTKSREIFERLFKYLDEQKKSLEDDKQHMFASYLGR